MSRPEHLGCVNTAAGIARISENQRHYDVDPKRYEREEREHRERMEREEMEARENG